MAWEKKVFFYPQLKLFYTLLKYRLPFIIYSLKFYYLKIYRVKLKNFFL